MVKLQRFYTFTSFIIIFLTAALLVLFFRQVTMQWALHLAETNHQAVAQIALNSIRPDLMDYLGGEGNENARKIDSPRLPTVLAEKIRSITHDTAVNRVDIYGREGLPVFSTNPEPTGIDQGRDPALMSALSGNSSTSMIFRSLLDGFRESSQQGQLMKTYLPIRSEPGLTVMGVLAIHSDISHLIDENDRVLLLILGGVEFILAILYAILMLVARHAKKIIDAQQISIRERTTSLEIFSRHLLNKEELKKKKIATDLHEGLAQTLSAIKVKVESNKLDNTSGHTQSLGAIVPVLQHAIHEVRSIATELRPSSLDDLGLLPTINWFCREFEFLHPGILIQREISLAEYMIPSQLKVDIYRIVESAFKNIAEHSNTDQVRIALHLADDMIHLVIGDAPTRLHATASKVRTIHSADPQFRFAETRERTSLSGGIFSARLEQLCWVTLRASWACGK